MRRFIASVVTTAVVGVVCGCGGSEANNTPASNVPPLPPKPGAPGGPSAKPPPPPAR